MRRAQPMRRAAPATRRRARRSATSWPARPRPNSARFCRPTSRGDSSTDLSACLPDFVIEAMREALPASDRQIAGYDHPDVILTGVETRTSSPVRITRGKDFQSLNTAGLLPAGEGAGYAGGILSAAVDGIKVAEAVALQYVAEGPIPATTWKPTRGPIDHSAGSPTWASVG
ncbi:FAD-dependent protein [Caulobacter segnis]